MAMLNAAKVIRRVRKRLELSQEGLSRHLNATKGAVQHWERGRNKPDLARLLALRQICPGGPQRNGLDNLIRRTQMHVAPLILERQSYLPTAEGPLGESGDAMESRGSVASPNVHENLAVRRRELLQLKRQVTRLAATIESRNEQWRAVEARATDLERELARLRNGQSEKVAPSGSSDAPRLT